MISTTILSVFGTVVLYQLGSTDADNNNGGLPYSNSGASSTGTVPNGTMNLGNIASAGYSSGNGFQASANTQNSATGPNASIQSTASANSVSGIFANQNWIIVANGNGFSVGSAATGQLQNQDQSNITAQQNIMGQGQSQISGTGTQVNLQSTANAVANYQQVAAKSKAASSVQKPLAVQSGNSHKSVSIPLRERKMLLNVLSQQDLRFKNVQQNQPVRNPRSRA